MARLSLKEQVKKLAKSKNVMLLKLENGETAESVLKEQAERFADILREEIVSLVYGRDPSDWYKRTFDLAFSVDTDFKINKENNTIRVGFNDKAWHDSWITKSGRNSDKAFSAYVPMAVIEGYEVFNTGHHIPGVDFMQAAIDRFESEKRPGISIVVEGKDALSGNWWR